MSEAAQDPDQYTPRVNSPLEALKLVVCGMCIGAADLVPGVSGGTMAFITGIYEELLDAICSFDAYALKCLFTLRWRELERHVGWKFLAYVLFGVVLSLAIFSHFLIYSLNHPVYRSYLYAGFFGLILGSVFFCSQKIQRWRTLDIGMMILGALLALIVTTYPRNPLDLRRGYDVILEVEIKPIGHEGIRINNFDSRTGAVRGVSPDVLAAMLAKGVVSPDTRVFSHATRQFHRAGDLVQPSYGVTLDPWLMLCGAIAISAMLLPGISGSYLLTLLGCYPMVLGAVADLTSSLRSFSLDPHACSILVSVSIGIVAGLVVFSRLITWLLHHHHDAAVALLIGFMLGALHSVWPFWSYEYHLLPLKLSKGLILTPLEASFPGWGSPLLYTSLAVGFACFAVVVLMERWAQGHETAKS